MLGTSTREKKLAIAAGTVLALLLLDRLWRPPLARMWTQVKEETDSAAAQLAKAQWLVKNGDSIRKDYQQAMAEIEKKSATPFESYLVAVERRAGVREKHRRPLPQSRLRDRTISSVQISLEGSLDNLGRLLHDLETSPRLLRVTRLSIRSREGKSDLDIEMNIAALGPADDGRGKQTSSSKGT